MKRDSAAPADTASLAIQRLLRRLEGKDLEGKLAALERERRKPNG